MDNKELQKRVNWYEKKYGPYIEKKGLHNWKNLFKKPTLMEWTILVMIIMSLFIAWAYTQDVQACSEWIPKIQTQACSICNDQLNAGTEKYIELNLTNLKFKEG